MSLTNGNATAGNGGANVQVADARNKPQSTAIATLPGGQTVDLSSIGQGSDSPRYEVFLHGYMHGRESLTPDLERVRWERDLWFFCYTNGKTPADFMRAHTDALWAGGVA